MANGNEKLQGARPLVCSLCQELCPHRKGFIIPHEPSSFRSNHILLALVYEEGNIACDKIFLDKVMICLPAVKQVF